MKYIQPTCRDEYVKKKILVSFSIIIIDQEYPAKNVKIRVPFSHEYERLNTLYIHFF